MLDEALVKSLTGSDTVTARFLYRGAFDFRPQFKIWIRGNHKPTIRGTDPAIWERVRLVPFTTYLPEERRDKDLKTKLEAELPGILAWAVRGCIEWQKHGLANCEKVKLATSEYRDDMDTLKQFIDRRVMEGRRPRRGARDRRASTGEAGDASRRRVIVGAVSHRVVVRRCGRRTNRGLTTCRVMRVHFGVTMAEMHHEHSDTPGVLRSSARGGGPILNPICRVSHMV